MTPLPGPPLHYMHQTLVTRTSHSLHVRHLAASLAFPSSLSFASNAYVDLPIRRCNQPTYKNSKTKSTPFPLHFTKVSGVRIRFNLCALPTASPPPSLARNLFPLMLRHGVWYPETPCFSSAQPSHFAHLLSRSGRVCRLYEHRHPCTCHLVDAQQPLPSGAKAFNLACILCELIQPCNRKPCNRARSYRYGVRRTYVLSNRSGSACNRTRRDARESGS
ncbi:hypothetical protein IF1G_02172 [Cordyceps javanica]|uniref:Uncharacterized protein n=1 Tax=Cordyceps javanica TaxID=43265 RepID=A0A545VE03_9HYPO|nr:hypothetical protein IF1G_02172 [Cordyceps javanica]